MDLSETDFTLYGANSRVTTMQLG